MQLPGLRWLLLRLVTVMVNGVPKKHPAMSRVMEALR
jgi:hypothetical protein